ncbi:unnamed protein product [Penicillium salamii]|nr:unnamed protein product [Penicillium salamii]CAG8187416.1 unnamed protein product [Penicillium salamii]CAG8384024.1 unnamed protein product [Penicillium salamii]
MSNPLSPLSTSYQNARAQSQMANSSPFLHKTLDQASENAAPSSPLKREWTSRAMSSPNAYDENENYPNESDYDNAHENHDDHDINDTESYQAGVSSPFQYEAREDTVNYQKLRQMRQTSQSYPQLDPLEEEEPASSPFRPNAAEDTVDFQRIRDVDPMPPGVDRRLALEEPMSSPFRPQAVDETAGFHDLQEGQSSPLARPETHTWEEDSPQSSPFRPHAQEETVDFHNLREVEPLSPGIERRLAVEDPASSPFRPDAQEEAVNFQRLREVEPLSPGIERRLAVEDPASSPFRPDAREETVNFDRLREVEPLSPGIEKRLAIDEPASSPFRPDAREETVDLDRLREMQNPSPVFEAEQSPEPASSPFRYQARKEPSESPKLYEVQEDSPMPNTISSPVVVPSSPSRAREPEAEEPVEQHDMHPQPLEVPQDSSPAPEPSTFQPSPNAQDHGSPKLLERRPTPEESHNSSPAPPPEPVATTEPSPKEHTLNLHKPRRISRISLGLSGQRPASATPRKRSYDQTPQEQEESLQVRASHKKGMMSRPEPPAIHVESGDSSIVQDHQDHSLLTTSAAQDRSAIGNSLMEDRHNEGMSTVLHEDGEKENVTHAQESNETSMVDDSMDDTCLSTFSAVPDMTTFAKLRSQSPMKSMRGSVGPGSAVGGYRRSVDPNTPGTDRRAYRASAHMEAHSPTGSPTPRPRGPRDMNNPMESGNLLDLSESMNFQPRQSMQSNRFSPRRSPMRPARQSMRSPGKMSSLLDFDIPPAPTPRSIPTVTPRELESLKSGFMSEISSLRATLSGKDAEVASLKQAVVDSERRVGEALEELRNEAAVKEELEIEQAEWGRRGKEMETVLLSVQSQLTDGERERENLLRRAEEAETSKEKLEQRVVELETRLSSARASASSASSANASRSASNSAEDTAREVQDAVEKVARELHTLYKGKHETKVAALKKSYESRWEKRLRESEKKLVAAREENDHLRYERDAAQSDPMAAGNTSLFARENEEHEAEKRAMEAQIQGLQKEMASLRDDTERIRSDLEVERAEKGDLVAAVDEWLAMQQPPSDPQRERGGSTASSHGPTEEARVSREATPDDFRRSIPRSGSGNIRPPATAEKRIPRFGAPGHSRGNSGGKSGIAMPTPGRGIMGSIERMGRGGA